MCWVRYECGAGCWDRKLSVRIMLELIFEWGAVCCDVHTSGVRCVGTDICVWSSVLRHVF